MGESLHSRWNGKQSTWKLSREKKNLNSENSLTKKKQTKKLKLTTKEDTHIWPTSTWKVLSSVQSLSRVQLFATPWTAAHKASLPITNSWSLLKILSIESVIPANTLILCHLRPSHIQYFPESGSFQMSQLFCVRYWSFSFNIRPSKEYSGLISFRMDWLDLLAVQGTLKSLLKCHSSKE